MREPVTANRLLVVLCAYFVVVIGAVFTVSTLNPQLLPYFPLGGNDVMEIVGVDGDDQSFFDRLESSRDVESEPATSQQIGMLALFLGLSLGGTVVVMLPVSWTYAAIKREVGYRKSFARALIVLPIIASTTVLLIQNNLALAGDLCRPCRRYRPPRGRVRYGVLFLCCQYSLVENGLRPESRRRSEGRKETRQAGSVEQIA
jgi:hypothetical protein